MLSGGHRPCLLGVHLSGRNRKPDPQWLKQIEVSQFPDMKSREGRARLVQQLREGLKDWYSVSPCFAILTVLAVSPWSQDGCGGKWQCVSREQRERLQPLCRFPSLGRNQNFSRTSFSR